MDNYASFASGTNKWEQEHVATWDPSTTALF